jgi:prevent-host-death family protein
MVRRLGIRELRDNLTTTVRRVREGETIEITHDGEPVAVLSPFPKGRIERLLARGDVSRPEPLTRPIRRVRVTGPITASEALERDRDED